MAADSETDILIVGAGPVGMLAALQLARFGVPSILAEQSEETTRWPKMDLTNCRSMEILRMLGIASEYRSLEDAVPEDAGMESVFSTGFHQESRKIASWSIPTLKEWREQIKAQNDGTWTAEPGMRCTQIVFEGFLKRKCLEQPLIDGRFGWKYMSHGEDEEGVSAKFVTKDGRERNIRAEYLVAADGGGSRVRKHAGIKMIGGAMPGTFFLVHFKSADFAARTANDHFWHYFSPDGSIAIAQDERETFTVHTLIEDANNPPDPYEAVYRVLGGSLGPLKIKVDEILVSSAWNPNFAVADRYFSALGRVMLVGDAAHRNPPHGGYGMNSGVEDSLAVAWRLAALYKGYAGPHLLPSYQAEQRTQMIRRSKRCHEHFMVHIPKVKWYLEHPDKDCINDDSDEGKALRKKMHDWLMFHGSECLDRGIEVDTRYRSPVILRDGEEDNLAAKPKWDYREYIPGTWPGMRAPHVFLEDGKTSTVDFFKGEWTLVGFEALIDGTVSVFRGNEKGASELFMRSTNILTVAREYGMPVTHVNFAKGGHVHGIWGQEFDLFLVRADGHVAWRGKTGAPLDEVKARRILRVVTGHEICPGYEEEVQDMDVIVKLTEGFDETTAAEVEKPVMKTYD